MSSHQRSSPLAHPFIIWNLLYDVTLVHNGELLPLQPLALILSNGTLVLNHFIIQAVNKGGVIIILASLSLLSLVQASFLLYLFSSVVCSCLSTSLWREVLTLAFVSPLALAPFRWSCSSVFFAGCDSASRKLHCLLKHFYQIKQTECGNLQFAICTKDFLP